MASCPEGYAETRAVSGRGSVCTSRSGKCVNDVSRSLLEHPSLWPTTSVQKLFTAVVSWLLVDKLTRTTDGYR